MKLHTSDSDQIEITRATNPESRVRSSCHFFYYDTQKPRSGVRRGAPAEPWRVSQNPESEADGTWQVHMVPDPGSAIRSDRGKPPRRTQSPGSRLRTPASCPPAVRCAETRVQSPEGTTGGPRREGPTRRIQSPASGGAPEAAGGRQGPRIQGQALRGGGGEGQDPEGQGGGGRTPGFISTNEKPKKIAPLSPAGTQD